MWLFFSWLAVFVLPLNAVADPVLYTLKPLLKKKAPPAPRIGPGRKQ